MAAALEAFEFPDQLPRFFLPVPGLAAGWLGFLLIATADTLYLLRHGADNLQARSVLVTAKLRLHSDVDEHLRI